MTIATKYYTTIPGLDVVHDPLWGPGTRILRVCREGRGYNIIGPAPASGSRDCQHDQHSKTILFGDVFTQVIESSSSVGAVTMTPEKVMVRFKY